MNRYTRRCSPSSRPVVTSSSRWSIHGCAPLATRQLVYLDTANDGRAARPRAGRDPVSQQCDVYWEGQKKPDDYSRIVNPAFYFGLIRPWWRVRSHIVVENRLRATIPFPVHVSIVLTAVQLPYTRRSRMEQCTAENQAMVNGARDHHRECFTKHSMRRHES